MSLIKKRVVNNHLELNCLGIKVKVRLEQLNKTKQHSSKQIRYSNDYKYNNIVSKYSNKILIIGRKKTGDSIAVHTQAFLNTIDYNFAEIYLYDEYTKSIYKCVNKKEQNFIEKIDIMNLNGEDFDLLLYLNPINHGDIDLIESKLPLKKPLISMCYSVFDGTIPPKGWVSSINQHFDALLVPVKSLVDIFKQYGVLKPVFELPVAQDYASYLQHTKKLNSVFRFSWSGLLEPRKNPTKILKAFIETFGENSDVELVLHTRAYDKQNLYVKEFFECLKKAPKNVKFSCGVITQQENNDFINSLDCCIYPSMAEGFSNVPRESLASGSCVILSDIPTHKSITNKGEDIGLYWLNAKKEIPAICPALNNQQLGVMYDIDIEDLKQKMLELYNNKDTLFASEKINERKEIGKLYDYRALIPYYNVIINPKSVVSDIQNELCDKSIKTDSLNLQTKYQYYMKNKKRKFIVQCPNDAGFFSMFNQYITHLVYAKENEEFIIPDWRVQTLKINIAKTFNRQNFESFCYGTKKDNNIFLKFFMPPYANIEIPEILYTTDIMYNVADKVLDIQDYNSSLEPNLTYINSYNLYNDKEYFPKFREKYNKVIKKYIHLQPHIQKRIDNFYENNMKNHFCISAHIRCKAHATELLEVVPEFEKYKHHIIDILNKNDIDVNSDSWRLFIASDNDDAINYFKQQFPQNIIHQNGITRLTTEQENEYMAKRNEIGKDFAGLELQHRCAQNESSHSLKMGEDILTDAYLLSKGNYFIFVNSNVSTAVSYLNPDIEMVYCA